MTDKENKDYSSKQVLPGYLILLGISGIACIVIYKVLTYLKELL